VVDVGQSKQYLLLSGVALIQLFQLVACAGQLPCKHQPVDLAKLLRQP
jgi:hypothetical protein